MGGGNTSRGRARLYDMSVFWLSLSSLKRELVNVPEWIKPREMTPEEIFEQKVSWVYGQLLDCNPEITKDQVRKRLRDK